MIKNIQSVINLLPIYSRMWQVTTKGTLSMFDNFEIIAAYLTELHKLFNETNLLKIELWLEQKMVSISCYFLCILPTDSWFQFHSCGVIILGFSVLPWQSVEKHDGYVLPPIRGVCN